MGGTRRTAAGLAIPPRGGFTSDDLDGIPDLPPHTELIDGSLVFVSPQKSFHSLAMYPLEQGLRATAPETLRVRREMSVVLNRRNRPEPDLVLVRAEAARDGADETGYQASGAVLVVEAAYPTPPDSEERDRKRKPQLYAEAGIPRFCRVEKGEGRLPVVHVFEREPGEDGRASPPGLTDATALYLAVLAVTFAVSIPLNEAGVRLTGRTPRLGRRPDAPSPGAGWRRCARPARADTPVHRGPLGRGRVGKAWRGSPGRLILRPVGRGTDTTT